MIWKKKLDMVYSFSIANYSLEFFFMYFKNNSYSVWYLSNDVFIC